MQIEIEQLAPIRVAAVRHVGPYNQIGKAFERLGALAGPSGLVQPPNGPMLGIYHDDPRQTPAEKLRSDAGIAVQEGTPIPDGLEEQRIPGGRYARVTHVGPYEGLSEAWPQFGISLGAGGYRMRAGPGFEIYRNDMSTTPKAELRTDLYMPVE
jgi:AraC family transcriptional regulator